LRRALVFSFVALFPCVARGQDDGEEVRVRGRQHEARGPSTEVPTAEARRVPGAHGDALSVVESLPGVARTSPGSGQIVVWGAAPQDTRVFVDGIPVPRLYHDGGYRSVLHSDLVASVELLPGGYGPAYGRGLGGVIAVKRTDLDAPGVHGSVAADVLDASATLRAAVSERWRVGLALRRSHLDDVIRAAGKERVADLVPVPRWYDGQARAVYLLSNDETVELGGLFSTDTTDRTVSSIDPLARRGERRTLDFQRYHARYEKRIEGGAASVLPFFGIDRSTLGSVYGSTPIETRVLSHVFGARIAWQGPVAGDIRGSIGLDAQFMASRASRLGSIGAPPREGDVRHFLQRPPEEINADDWKAVTGSFAPYAALDIPIGLFRLSPGARIEPYLTSANRKTPRIGDAPAIGSFRQQTVVEPRMAVKFVPSPSVSMSASYGHYHQSPMPDDLSAVFGNPTLGIARAEQATIGCAFKPLRPVDVELTSFVASGDDLVARSTAPAPALARALESTGSSRTIGSQLLVRVRRIAGLSGWVAYTLSRSRRRDDPSRGERLFDFDQTHVLTALGSYDVGWGIDVGLRARWATGFPRAPVVGAVHDDATDAYVPLFGPVGSMRLPATFSIDARVAKRFRMGDTEGEVYVEVLNATNHRNVEEVVYSTSYRRSGAITGLPVLPVAGARLAW
jgi:outer membrane receptor protein involved in Fe transport